MRHVVIPTSGLYQSEAEWQGCGKGSGDVGQGFLSDDAVSPASFFLVMVRGGQHRIGPHLALLRADCRLCGQESLLAELRKSSRAPEIKPGFVVCKVSAFIPLPSLWLTDLYSEENLIIYWTFLA